MNMQRLKWLLTGLALTTISREALAQMSSPPPAQPPVALVSSVTASDPTGKLLRFTNPVGREFSVTYGTQAMPVSVNCVTGPNVADITSIGYDKQKRVSGFTLRTGYTVSYDYAADGTQLIHDRAGGELIRSSQGTTIQAGTGAGALRLQAVVAALDSILKYSAP